MFRMREIMMSITLDSELTQRVESLAKVAGRSNANQTAYLLEKGLQLLEQRLILTNRGNGDYVTFQISSLL
jgi:predicted DNA-binding protein